MMYCMEKMVALFDLIPEYMCAKELVMTLEPCGIEKLM